MINQRQTWGHANQNIYSRKVVCGGLFYVTMLQGECFLQLFLTLRGGEVNNIQIIMYISFDDVGVEVITNPPSNSKRTSRF